MVKQTVFDAMLSSIYRGYQYVGEVLGNKFVLFAETQDVVGDESEELVDVEEMDDDETESDVEVEFDKV